MKKVMVLLLVTIMIVISGINLISCNRETSGTTPVSTYHMDDNYEFIRDIPRDNYLSQSIPLDGEKIYNITTYGASVSADSLINQSAIQSAIDAASSAGGGVVLVSGGSYKSSRIELKDDVTLRINSDSELECLTYEENKMLNVSDRINDNGFISANNAERVIIEGPGRISGNGATYCNPSEDNSAFLPLDTFNLKTYILEHRKRIMMGKEHEFQRVIMIAMNYCTDVVIRNIELYEASSWTCRLEGMENLLIEDVIINNNVNVANTDGFDIEGGKNITIRHCFIATGDDAICIKTDNINIPPLDGMLVEDCEIMSLANCFKIGTGTWTDVSNVTVRNCFFFMAGIAGGYAGIAIEAVDGGKISNINIDNIVMENIASPLLIWLGYRNNSSELHDIAITNITATGCDIACAVVGYQKGNETKYVKNVTLRNFDITYREAEEDLNIYHGTEGAYEGTYNMGGYPEITRVSHRYLLSHSLSDYWDLPVYGLFARHVDGLTVHNFVVNARTTNTRPMNNIQDEGSRINVKNVVWS